MKFRLTIGENGTPYGKQTVIHSGNAANAIEFVRNYAIDAFSVLNPMDAQSLLDACWVDAGIDTIPIPVQNLKWIG